MEACTALQASATFHSEFARTLLGESVTVSGEGFFGDSAGRGDKAKANLLAQAKDAGFFWCRKFHVKTFKRRTTLMDQGCASSRLQAAEIAADAPSYPIDKKEEERRP